MKTVEQFAREFMENDVLHFLKWAKEMQRQGVTWIMDMAIAEKKIIVNKTE